MINNILYYLAIGLGEEGIKYIFIKKKYIYISTGIFSIIEFVLYLYFFDYGISLYLFIFMRILAIISHFLFVNFGFTFGNKLYSKYLLSSLIHMTYNLLLQYNLIIPWIFLIGFLLILILNEQ